MNSENTIHDEQDVSNSGFEKDRNEVTKAWDLMEKDAVAAAETGDTRDGVLQNPDQLSKAIRIQQATIRELEEQAKKAREEIDKMDPGPVKTGLEEETSSIEADLKTEKEVFFELETAYNQNKQSDAAIQSETQSMREEATDSLEGEKGAKKYGEPEGELESPVVAYKEALPEQQALTIENSRIAGLTSGMEGFIGLMTAGQGVANLFVKESEKLVEIQTRLQAVMSILTGLQAASNTLHQTSAFRITTVGKVTQAWGNAQTWVATTLGISNVAAKALMGTLTLGLSVAVGGIISLINKLNQKNKEAKQQQEELEKSQEEFSISVGSNAANTIASVQKMSNEWEKLGSNLKAKEEYIKDNTGLFKQLGVDVSSVHDAENLLVDNTEEFIKSVIKKAQASATMEVAAEKYKEAVIKMLEADNISVTKKDYAEAYKAANNHYGELLKSAKNYYDRLSIQNAWDNGGQSKFVSDYLRNLAEKQRKVIEGEADVIISSASRIVEAAGGMFENADKAAEDAGINLIKTTKRTTSNLANAIDERIKAQEDYNRAILSARERLASEEISLEREKIKDKSDLIEFDRLQVIKAIEKTREEARQAWQKGGEEGTFNDAVFTDLINQANIQADFRIAEEKSGSEKEEAKKLEGVLLQYQSYYQKRLDAANKFEEDRKKLEEAGASDEQLAELDYQANEALAGIDEQFAMRESSFQAWMNSIADMSVGQLKQALAQAKQELDKLQKEGVTDNRLAEAYSKVNKAEKALENPSPDKRTIKEWKALHKVLSSVEKDFKEIGDAVGGTVGKVMNAAGTVASGAISMIDGIQKLASGALGATETAAGGASTAIKTAEKASVILAIIGAALKVMQAIFSLFSKTSKKEKDTKQLEDVTGRIALMQGSINKMLEKRVELIAQATAAEAAYLNTLSQANIEEQKGYIEKQFENLLGNEIFGKRGKNNNLSLRKLMEKEGLNGIEDFVKWWNEEGGVAKLTAEGYGLRNESQWQSLVDSWGNLVKSAEESKNAMLEAATGMTFDDLKNGLDDLVMQADLAFGDIQDSFEDHMRNAILNLVKNQTLNKQLEAWYERFAGAMGNNELTAEEAEELQREYERIVREANESYKKAMEVAGISLESSLESTPESERSSAAKGFAAASQDSIDKLEGVFTNIQLHTYDLRENSNFLVEQSKLVMGQWQELQVHNSQVLRHLSGIHENTNRLEGIERGINSMRLDIEQINNIGINLRS